MTPDSAPLVIALVGHSNVGKTSLVSALTRDASLEVREEAGTTRATYRKVFRLDELPVLAFIDTPGFEQAGRMNKWLDGRATGEGARLDGRALLDTLLADTGSDARFAAEKEALRGALQADVLAYVADVSQPPTGQQRQELRLLRRAGVPLIAVRASTPSSRWTPTPSPPSRRPTSTAPSPSCAPSSPRTCSRSRVCAPASRGATRPPPPASSPSCWWTA